MSPDEAWAALGIEPTQDARAIKAAYAQRLKTIDPEADPRGFVRLRGAYETATNLRGQQVAAPERNSVPDTEQDDASEAPVGQAAAGPLADDPSERHANAILALLYGHRSEDPWLGPEARDELIQHWRALVADPRMEQIDHYARVEHWARGVIVDTSPLSAPILMIAAEFFKWIDADTEANADPYMAEIARRYRMLQLLRNASRPGTVWHPAWVELRTRAEIPNYSRIDPQRVFEILAAMRYALPELEGEFDPLRVRSWEARLSHIEPPRTRPSRWGGCIAAAVFVPLMIALAVWVSRALTHAIGAGAVR